MSVSDFKDIGIFSFSYRRKVVQSDVESIYLHQRTNPQMSRAFCPLWNQHVLPYRWLKLCKGTLFFPHHKTNPLLFYCWMEIDTRMEHITAWQRLETHACVAVLQCCSWISEHPKVKKKFYIYIYKYKIIFGGWNRRNRTATLQRATKIKNFCPNIRRPQFQCRIFALKIKDKGYWL